MLADRELRAKRLRRFSLTPNADGAWTAAGQLEPVAGATLHGLLGRLARRDGPDDQRTHPQRMADALATVTNLAAGNPAIRTAEPADAAHSHDDASHGDRHDGGHAGAGADGDGGGEMDRAQARRVARAMAATRAQVLVITTVDALHGVPGAAPAEVDGYGAVCTATARQVCCDAEVTTVVTAADGDVLRVGRTRRNPTTRQRVAVIVRDRRCVGCNAPAVRCQIHHVRWWSADGPTDVDNLTLLCWSCHANVHHDFWTVTRDADGRYTARPPRACRPETGAAPQRHTP